VFLQWLLGVARGVAVLHGIQPVEIVHRDLKAANALLGEKAGGGTIAKVADFGLAKTMETFQSTVGGQTRTRNGGGGTLAWKAPETFKGRYSRKSDVFGFGMIVYETVCRKQPFDGQAEPEITGKLFVEFKENMRLLQNYGVTVEQQKEDWLEDLQESLQDRRPDLEHVDPGCPERLIDLMQDCWADDAAVRPSIHAAVDALQELVVELGAPDPAELAAFLQA
jgi:serine/threonine protein kinase